MTAAHVMSLGPKKELAWLKKHGRPRMPYDRISRDITNYQKSDPSEHAANLQLYLRIASQLVPAEDYLQRPILRHPDLNPNNIFVSEDLDITGIIDWQHTVVQPLFLNAGIPAHLQNYDDPISDSLTKPTYPDNLDELSEEERQRDLELYRRRHVHFFYCGATATELETHFNAIRAKDGALRRRLYEHASEPWEGNNILLAANLVQATRFWDEIRGKDSSEQCPISFEESQAEDIIDKIIKQEDTERRMGILREELGIGTDGWLPTAHYDSAVKQVAKVKAEALAVAGDDEFEREMTLKHWPFDDHDEEE